MSHWVCLFYFVYEMKLKGKVLFNAGERVKMNT